MSGSIEQEAANIIAPLVNIAAAAGVPAQVTQMAIAVTTTSTVQDLSGISAIGRGHFITLQADGGDVYIAFNKVNGGTIDNTATGVGTGICQRIPSGQDRTYRLPNVDSPNDTAYQYLLHKTSTGTATLRISISSLSPNSDVRELRA